MKPKSQLGSLSFASALSLEECAQRLEALENGLVTVHLHPQPDDTIYFEMRPRALHGTLRRWYGTYTLVNCEVDRASQSQHILLMASFFVAGLLVLLTVMLLREHINLDWLIGCGLCLLPLLLLGMLTRNHRTPAFRAGLMIVVLEQLLEKTDLSTTFPEGEA